MLGGCITGCLYFRTVVGNLLGYLLCKMRVTRLRLLIEWLKLCAEGLRVDSKGFLCIGDVFRIACLLAQSKIALAHLSIYSLEDFRKNIAFDFYGSCGESGNLILGIDGTLALRDSFLVGFCHGLGLFCLTCHLVAEFTHGVHLLLKCNR